MVELISLLFNMLILGLIVHWILGLIKSTQYSQIEKVRSFLDKIYGPLLDLIKDKIKPVIKMRDGRHLDFSSIILLVIFAIARKLVYFIL